MSELGVGPMVPASVQTVADIAAGCRPRPAAIYVNAGAGSLSHRCSCPGAEDARVACLRVPYRGGLIATQALAAEIVAALASESAAPALEQAGKLRVIATSGNERSYFLPKALPVRESGYVHLSQREWVGAFMPAKALRAVIDATAEAIGCALREAEVRGIWNRLALSAESSTPMKLALALRTEHDFSGPIIKANGFSPEAQQAAGGSDSTLRGRCWSPSGH